MFRLKVVEAGNNTDLLNTWSQLRRMVSYQFVNLLPWTLDNGQALRQSRFEGYWSSHGLAGPGNKDYLINSILA